jgi:hypothetical protein
VSVTPHVLPVVVEVVAVDVIALAAPLATAAWRMDCTKTFISKWCKGNPPTHRRSSTRKHQDRKIFVVSQRNARNNVLLGRVITVAGDFEHRNNSHSVDKLKLIICIIY